MVLARNRSCAGSERLQKFQTEDFCIVLFFVIIKFFPDIMQLLDNFVGIINS